MGQKKYWKGLEQLENSPAYQASVANEFREELPFADVSESLMQATTPRRDFLKYLGFSTAAALLAASCEMPVRKVIPYAIKPEDITPGVPNYYASSFVDGGDYCPIIIKTRDGRPIKVEGNEESSITKGGTSARVQASVLSLYDKTRLRQPMADKQPIDMFSALDKRVMDDLAAKVSATKPLYLVTATVLSPTVKDVITGFLAKFPGSKHIVYDAVSYSGMILANEASYGKRAIPSYHFEEADTIVSLGADFLGTWLSPVEFARGYSIRRKVSAKDTKNMSRHYQFEGNHTISGAAADHRATCRPSEMGAVAIALYNAVTSGTAPTFASDHLNKSITQAAIDLKKGKGLVVTGSNDVSVQTVVNAINDKIGANGTTINWAVNSNYRQGIDADMVALAAEVKAGNVGALLMHGVNPAYEFPDATVFTKENLAKAVTVSFADRVDETANLCTYIVPDHHFLESWGDAEPKTGYFGLMQPGIAPLFKTRAFADSLLTWSGSTISYGDMWKSYWLGKLGSQTAFDEAIQKGIIEPATMQKAGGSFNGNIAEAMGKITAAKTDTSAKEIIVYEKVAIGRGGVWSNNPWLLEMPDPITKATWDNYACISPKFAKDLDGGKGQEFEVTGINEVITAKHVLKLTLGDKIVSLPAVVVPGMHNDVIAIAVGYGRSKEVGMAAASDDMKGGKNAYPFLTWNGTTYCTSSTGLKVDKTDGKYDVAITQTHQSYEGRPIVHEFTLEEFEKNPKELLHDRMEEIGKYSVLPWVGHDEVNEGKGSADQNETHEEETFEQGFRENGTMYPDYKHEGIHWGMSVDVNACIGCGACVIGCQAENNISVVGKAKVLKSQEMHWITIDRYFAGNPDDSDSIQTIFQPMMCQHCDNAPCENVCPVSATNHSSEGINQMAYNRCIGTKYCANNCPYKVRHFNWMDWNGADCFDDNLYEDGRRDDMNDDLTRMVLNPDVTVRSRGVMEKCSFCVQRLQDAKLVAKKDGRPLRDGEARTACQQACPTDAILFGNVNDKTSALYKLRHEELRERSFYVLEDLHTLPNVNYLAKVRNTDNIIAGTDKDILATKHV